MAASLPRRSAVRAAYGSEALALQAVRQNPTIVNPLYTNPPKLIPESKAGLVKAMGSEAAALEVLVQNPGLLQCGRELELQPPDEIRRFAAFRAIVDKVPPQASLAALSTTLLVGISTIALRESDSSAIQEALAVTRPLLAIPAVGLFLAALGNAFKAQKDLRRAEEALGD